MKNLLESAERCFLKEAEAEKFFENVCATDVWIPCYTKELRAVPIDNAPILEQSIREQMLISSEVSSESLLENMDSLNIGLQIPLSSGYTCYPLGDTAYGTLVQRAGFQNSPVLFVAKDKSSMNAMSPLKKAEVINMGLSCYKNLSLVLIRDEKIRAVLSGDENDYVVLRFDQLLSSLKTRLSDMFSNVTFNEASASHMFFIVEYSFTSNVINELAPFFNRLKVDSRDMLLSVKLISSDVGLSGANLFPYINIKGKSFQLGKPITLTHKNQHSLIDFTVNITQLGASFMDSTDKLTKMSQENIKHPAGCLLRVAKQAGLPKKLSCEAAESLDALYGANCKQVDVFFALYDILEKYDAETALSASRRILIEEGISRIAFTNFANYDIPFQWE